MGSSGNLTSKLNSILNQEVAEATTTSPSFAHIQQGLKEPFYDFATRLREAIARKVKPLEAQDALFIRLAIEQANQDCQPVLRSLVNPTPMSMIQACKEIGSSKYESKIIAYALIEAEPVRVQAITDAIMEAHKANSVCHKCQKPGHFARDCPNPDPSPKLPRTLCPICKKGYHWARYCRSIFTKDGEPIQAKGGGTTGQTHNQQPHHIVQGNG
ncbi:hypothetical protein BTVI_158601 [Pitangus sulphuratus]|nr:hypothetical protein BTVI_158601 [Pitangus sulphuratus]